mgnify:CR=1 FL=1
MKKKLVSALALMMSCVMLAACGGNKVEENTTTPQTETSEAVTESTEEAENTEAAKAFIKWFFSDDENMKMMAEIDKNNTCLLVKPSLKGLELNFDKDQLMKEDLSLFGSKRTEILDKWSTLMGDKGEE